MTHARDVHALNSANQIALLCLYAAWRESAIVGGDPRKSYGVIHSNCNRCLGEEIHLFPFSRQNVGGASDQPDTETARHMTEDDSHTSR